MSARGEKAALSELLSGPALDLTVRAALARRVVKSILVPLWLITAGSVVAVIGAVGLSAPTRLVPSLIAASALLLVQRLTRRQRWVQAALVLSALLFVALASGVLLNSVHAPAFAGGLMLLPLVVPLFGARGGLVTLSALLLVGLLWLGLDYAGLSLQLRPATASMRIGLYMLYGLFGLLLTSRTAQLLAEALRDAEHKQSEALAARAAGAATELAFHAVFDQATTGMLLLSAAGTITQINEQAARLLGSSEADLIGQSLAVAPLWRAEQRRELSAAVVDAAQGRAQQRELSIAGEHDQPRVFQLRLSPFHDQSGQLGHVLAELIELTDLIATRSMLAEARRLEALGKLSGGVAHDINNMLAAIAGGRELARMGHAAGRTADVQAGLDVIDSSVQHAAALIKQLLAFGRRERFESADIDVNRLVNDMGQLFARTLPKRIIVKAVTSERPLHVRGDSAALENVLLNLALNAQDAMPNGGMLTLEAGSASLEQAQSALLEQKMEPGPVVVIRVSDTGTGISADVREHMFEPFFTTKPAGRAGHSKGLGLAAVHGALSNHQGAILVHSHEGQGTCIELLLPELVAPEVSEGPAQSMVVPKKLSAHVLLADDEPLVRSILTKMLSRAGCEVHAVNDGASLLQALEAGPDPDVIITDIVMPGLNGTRLISALEAVNPACPLLVMTGYTGEDIAEMLGETRRYQLLRKPFSQADLLGAIEKLLGPANETGLHPASA